MHGTLSQKLIMTKGYSFFKKSIRRCLAVTHTHACTQSGKFFNGKIYFKSNVIVALYTERTVP